MTEVAHDQEEPQANKLGMRMVFASVRRAHPSVSKESVRMGVGDPAEAFERYNELASQYSGRPMGFYIEPLALNNGVYAPRNRNEKCAWVVFVMPNDPTPGQRAGEAVAEDR